MQTRLYSFALQDRDALRRQLMLKFAKVDVIPPKPWYYRPVSALLRRTLGIPFSTLMLGHPELALRSWSPEHVKQIKKTLKTLEKFYGLSKDDIKVYLGSDRPLARLKRIWKNPHTSVAGKAFFTLVYPLTVLGMLAQSFVGGGAYDPGSHSIVVYGPNEAVAAHELGHAIDFLSKGSPTLYSLANLIPFVTPYQEYKATQIASSPLKMDPSQKKLLRAAFTTYANRALAPVGVPVLLPGLPLLSNLAPADWYWQKLTPQARKNLLTMIKKHLGRDLAKKSKEKSDGSKKTS